MNPPPIHPPVVIPEVLPPDAQVPPPGGPPPSGPTPTGRLAIHPLSALALIVVDNLWMIPEFAVVDWPVTIPLCFLSVFSLTFLIQRRRNGDTWSAAFWKALLLAMLAAVPWSVTGTPVGLALLAWAGIKHPWKSR